MPKYKIGYTEDFGETVKTLPVIEAEDMTKAYIEAYVYLPLRAAITMLVEVEDDGRTVL